MIVLTWCGSPMKWSHVVWKICPQHSPWYCREQSLSCSGYGWSGKVQVMKHDAYRLRVFAQWALGWHEAEAWAYGPRGLRARSQSKGLGSWAIPLGQNSGPKWAWGSLCRTVSKEECVGPFWAAHISKFLPLVFSSFWGKNFLMGSGRKHQASPSFSLLPSPN